MSVTLMTTLTPRAGDEENRFPAHYNEADQMARFSSISGCRHNNGKDKVALLAMYIIILLILCPGHHRPRFQSWGNFKGVTILLVFMSSFLEGVPSLGIVLLWCRESCVQKRWVNV